MMDPPDSRYYRVNFSGTWFPVPGTGTGRAGNYVAYSGPFNLSGYPAVHGACTIEYYGNGTAVRAAPFMLDTTPPATSFSAPRYVNGTFSTLLSVSDAGAGTGGALLRYRQSLDNVTWGNWTTDWSNLSVDNASFALTCVLSLGFYEIVSIGVDHLGNVETPAAKETIRCINPDFNGDGRVTVQDLAVLAAHFGEKDPPPAIAALYDIDGDGEVTLRDIGPVTRFWS
jgi:hypothetical protein